MGAVNPKFRAFHSLDGQRTIYDIPCDKERMPAYKKQHYLPAAYLKYFSIDQSRCNRRSRIWRFDRNEQRQASVENECFEKFHYSIKRPAKAEHQFHSSEGAYCKCLDKIRSGQEPTGANLGDLLLFMFDLHLRNKVHENLTGEERIDAYNVRAALFLSEVIGANGAQSTPQVGRLISERWSVIVFPSHPDHIFMTSDHPSIWLSLNRNNPVLHLVLLPLTPRNMAFAFDKKFVEIVSDEMTARDCLHMNIFQARQANQSLYASSAFREKDMEITRKELTRRFDSKSEVTESAWRFSLPGLPPECYFSFMRVKPPLL